MLFLLINRTRPGLSAAQFGELATLAKAFYAAVPADVMRPFGFRDDIVVRIRPQGTGSRIDIRAKSRIGQSDLGGNAERIRAFLARVKAET